MRSVGLWMLFLSVCFPVFAQVDTTFIYNTSTPYGTLDLRIAKSATRYYYLQEDITFSFRESAPGVKTNTYRDMTSWDSSPYRQGNLREKNGNQDLFVMNYRFLMPKNYDPNYEPGYPIILMLHGYGERANCWDNSCYWSTPSWNPNTNSPPAPTDPNNSLLNNDHNLLHGGLKHLNAVNLAGGKLPDDPTLDPQAFPGFVLFPQCLNGWHQSARVEEAIKLLRLIIKKYNVDPNRVYIHALSNGGGGLYQAIKRAPWLFAAALPMSAVSHSGAIDPGVIEEVANVPFWAFQGAKDLAPTPTMTYQIIKTLRAAGAEVRYSLYPHLGHGTWNTAYNEPDFFSWILSKRKNNPHVRYGRPSICATNGEGVHFSFSKGFAAYEWEKDGEILTTETSAGYVATSPGVVRGRFSRTENPSESDWEPWSDPIEVTEIAPAKAVITPQGSTHLRGPGLSSSTLNNTVILRSQQPAELYNWFYNGNPVDFPGTSVEDTLRTTTFISGNSSGNGSYSLVTSNKYCPSPPSDPLHLFFANSAPQNMTLDQENTQFRGVVVGDGIFLTWNDALTDEGGYEVWRRRNPSSPFEFAGRTNKDAISLYDAPLEPQTTYEYKFRAVSNSGVSNYLPSNNLDVNFKITTGDDHEPPAAPQDLKMILNTIHSITLSWTPSKDNTGIREYVIYYGSQSVSTGSSDNVFAIDDLAANREFPVTVQAIDYAGNVSPHSNQVIATTYMLGLNYKHSTGGWEDLDAPSMIATWADPEFQGHVNNITLAPRTQEDFFNFQFTGYLDIITAGLYQFSLRSDDGSRLIFDNSILIDNDGLHGPRTILSDTVQLSAGAHPIEIQYFDYSGGHQLTLMMKGPDDLSGSFLAIPDSLFRSAPYTPGSPPPKPTGLSATAAGMTRIDLSWQSSSTVEVYRATSQNGVYKVIGRSDSNNFSDVAGLTPSTTYYYKVKAINNSGASSLTGAVSATTQGDNSAPSVPTGLQIQTQSHTHVSITWNPSTDNVGVAGYRVYANDALIDTTAVAAVMIGELTPNTAYVIKITAFDSDGNESAKSVGLNVQTQSSTTYYSLASGALNNVATWKQNPDGTGDSPKDFSENGLNLIIINRSETGTGGEWNVTGNGSKVVIADGVHLIVNNPMAANVEMQGASALTLNVATAPGFIALSGQSTVNFNACSAIPVASYGNVILGAGTPVKNLAAGMIQVSGSLTVQNGVTVKGATGNGTSIAIGANLVIEGGTNPTAADNRINIQFASESTHDLVLDGGLYVGELAVGSNAVVNFSEDSKAVVFTGTADGGGVSLVNGSVLNLASGKLRVGYAGVINGAGETGKLRVDGASIFLESSSTKEFRLRFDDGSSLVDTLWVNVTGPGVNVQSALSVRRLLKIRNGNVRSNGNITMLSDVTGSAVIGEIEGTGQITGDIAVQHYLDPLPDAWRELATPVSGVTVADWQEFFTITGNFSGTSGGTTDPSMYVSNGIGLTPYPPAGSSNQAPISKGNGYYTLVGNDEPITIEVEGNPFQGEISFNLAAGNTTSGGWNLLGNPYLSPIKWSSDQGSWMSSGVSGVIAIKTFGKANGSTVARYDYYDPALGTALIEPGHGFWVRANNSAPTLVVTEKAKAAEEATTYPGETTSANYLGVRLAQGDWYDDTWIILTAGASMDIDSNRDGLKLLNEGTFGISSLVGGMDIAVNHIPAAFCGETVALDLIDTPPGDYVLSFSGIGTLADIGVVTLIDHLTGNSRPVADGPYEFQITSNAATSGDGRFSIAFQRNVLDVNSPELSATDVCAGEPANITIGHTQEGVGYVAVDSQGEQISSKVAGGPEEVVLTVNASALHEGTNHVRILAGYDGCTAEYLADEAEFTYTPPFSIEVEPEISVCVGDQAVIHASGLDNGSYRWFDENQAVIDSEQGPTLVTPPVFQEDVYYVAGIHENGCQSPLESVHVFPDSLEIPVIININDTLFTQADGSFQWKKEGSIIEGATKAYYIPESSGVYNVIAIKGGCVRESADFVFTVCIIDPSGPQLSAEDSCGEGPVPILVSNSQSGVEYFAIDQDLAPISGTVTGDGAEVWLSIAGTELDSGYNEVRVMARQSGCPDEVLESVASFNFIRFARPVIVESSGILFADSIGHLQWKKEGEAIPEANGATFIPIESGAYTVEVEVENCRVESLPFAYVIASTDEDLDLALNVFPVPGNSGNLSIKLVSPETGFVRVRLIDLSGQVAYQHEFDDQKAKEGVALFPVSIRLAEGLYVLIVNQGSREWRRRVVIRD